MCVYCNVGDRFSRWDPPWRDWHRESPYIPQPVIPPTQIRPWSIEKAREYLDILKEIKALEDQIGCPCEPNKADYIALLEKRIAALKAGSAQ